MKWNPEDYARQSSAQFSWAQELISRLAPGESETILDVGCGDGKITAAFANASPNGYVLGVDSSAEFIAYASAHYPPARFPSLHFQQMDARNLNCGRQFDLIFSNAALHWVDNQKAFLQGAADHLRVGGRLVTSLRGRRQCIRHHRDTSGAATLPAMAALFRRIRVSLLFPFARRIRALAGASRFGGDALRVGRERHGARRSGRIGRLDSHDLDALYRAAAGGTPREVHR